jgi:hypothetical protein
MAEIIISEFLGTAEATTVGTSAAQLFATPARGQGGRARTGFLITNCDDAGAELYVSNHSGVSATNFWYNLAVGETLYVPWEADITVYIIASAASTNYRAQEVRIRVVR